MLLHTFITITYRYYMLSNVEKEKLVLEMYYNQRKNVRQIDQEARISFRVPTVYDIIIKIFVLIKLV